MGQDVKNFQPFKKSKREIAERLEELGCDPLGYAAKLLQGEDTPSTHPWLKGFLIFINQLKECTQEGNPPPMSFINSFEEAGVVVLGPGTWLDPRVKARIAMEMLNYIYPKKQAIQYEGDTILNPNTPAENLTDAQLLRIVVGLAESKNNIAEIKRMEKELKDE